RQRIAAREVTCPAEHSNSPFGVGYQPLTRRDTEPLPKVAEQHAARRRGWVLRLPLAVPRERGGTDATVGGKPVSGVLPLGGLQRQPVVADLGVEVALQGVLLRSSRRGPHVLGP